MCTDTCSEFRGIELIKLHIISSEKTTAASQQNPIASGDNLRCLYLLVVYQKRPVKIKQILELIGGLRGRGFCDFRSFDCARDCQEIIAKFYLKKIAVLVIIRIVTRKTQSRDRLDDRGQIGCSLTYFLLFLIRRVCTMKAFFSKLALSLSGALIVVCCSCTTTEQVAVDTAVKPTAVETKPVETKPAAVEQKPKEQPDIVAEIDDYVITKKEFEKRLIRELRPDRSEYGGKAAPVDPETVLMKMIAEKAMIIEGRKQNLLEDDQSIKRFKEGTLVRLLLQTHLGDKITVTESEIAEKIKTDPKLDRARAEAMLKRSKSRKAIEQFYNEICKKLHVQKLRHNFPKAAQIHQRLLYRPQKPREVGWIRNRQIKEELTAGEKNIALTTYDNGKVTLKDWFETLNQMSPPRRPKDLNTIEGVERLLDRAMKMPIFVAEAKLRGLDKDENFLKQLKEREDRILLSKVRRKALEGLQKPTKEEIADYFNKHKEEFRRPDTLKIEQIWCEDLKTARKVKAELSSGKDFESVRQQYSLREKDRPFDTSAGMEGTFFDDLWNGEPNQIVGPVKGFYNDEIKWRIVKILEKKPGRMREYSGGVERDVKNRMRDEQREVIMAKYRKELLKKYSYRIYSERIKNIEPFDIP